MSSKVDLHVHSKHSRTSPEWLLRKVGFPHCGTEPKDLLALLRARGMDFFTITDHDSIDGCLEIADQSGCFLSEEITTYFPEDHCQIHILAWNITEAQHKEISHVRKDIHQLQAYLNSERIVHAVAHPLKSYDTTFRAAHFEKLLLLFRHFETVNGLCDGLYSEAMAAIHKGLSAERIEFLSRCHGIAPVGEYPWPRHAVGGSNDHTGFRPGLCFTETAKSKDVAEFLENVRRGQALAQGVNGSPISVAHSVYKNAGDYLEGNFGRSGGLTVTLLSKALKRFLEGENPLKLSFSEKLEALVSGVRSGKWRDLLKSGGSPLTKEIVHTATSKEFQDQLSARASRESTPERRAFITANGITDQLAFRLVERIAKQARAGDALDCLEQASALIPVALALAPYGYGFFGHTARLGPLQDIARSVFGQEYPLLEHDRRVWFTDTLYDVNGVSTTIRKMAGEAMKAGRELSVVTCAHENKLPGLPIENFTPIGEFEVPEYQLQKVAFPPILRIVDYIQNRRARELILSTPGPVGLCGLLAAKLLGLRTVSIYHTDFPQYVNILTDDSFLETVTWRFMHWFYNQTDLVYVNSEHYRQQWINRGIAPSKIAILPRGLDLEMYHPGQRQTDYWRRHGRQTEAPVVLYVGRVSKEKDLHVLAEAAALLRKRGLAFELAIVGDGPYLKEILAKIPGTMSTGNLSGAELAQAYASADVFAFPSTTDTYGNVVVEALASGLPCVVSDLGGPKDLVIPGETGVITQALNAESFAEGLAKLLAVTDREATRTRCRQSVAARDWSSAFARFWSEPAPKRGNDRT